eukprot:330551-Chlamydomonas_euryale.AAC.1
MIFRTLACTHARTAGQGGRSKLKHACTSALLCLYAIYFQYPRPDRDWHGAAAWLSAWTLGRVSGMLRHTATRLACFNADACMSGSCHTMGRCQHLPLTTRSAQHANPDLALWGGVVPPLG